MPLIDTPEEIKKHNSAVGSQIELNNVISYIDDAVNFYIIPAIGYAQFSALETLKNENPTALQTRLIELLQKSVVGFMIYNWADQGAVNISDTGIHVMSSPNMRPASDKKIVALKKQNIAAGYNALELAVSFLEENRIDFPIYLASEERKVNRSLMINTTAEFQAAGVFINSDARLYQKLRITQEYVEDTFIDPVLGLLIKKELHAALLSHSLDEIHLGLLKLVRKAIVFFTIAEAIPSMSITMDATGVFELSEAVGGMAANVETRSSASDKQLAIVMNNHLTKGESQLERIRKFLVMNKDQFSYLVPDEVNINEAGGNVYLM